jgi:YD repeat-containing protein
LNILSATYDPATGEMTALKDPYKKSAAIGDTAFAGDDARKSVTDLAGNKTEMEYDFQGRVVREIKEIKTNGKVSGYRVNVTKYVPYVTDDFEIGGLQTLIRYQPVTLDVSQKDQRHDFVPRLVASTTEFDRQGNVISQTDAAGHVTTLGGYTSGATDSDPVNPTDSRPTSTTDAYGNSSAFTYAPGDSGNLTSTTNSAGETTLYGYDDNRGNVTEVSIDRGAPGPDAPDEHDDVPTAESEYDGPDGQISVSESDFRKVAGDWVAMIERDYDYTPATINGQAYRRETVTLKWRDTPETTDANRHVLVESITLYDADDRTWKVTDSTGRTTETQYDALGKVAVTIDPFGGRTTYDYDVRGNLIRTLFPDGTETRTAYDDLGRVTWQTDRYKSTSNGSNFDNTTTALASLTVYDDFGQVVENRRYKDVLLSVTPDTSLDGNTGGAIRRADASGGMLLSTTSTQYDSAGRAWATTDAAGVRTETTYYDDGRAKNMRQIAPNLPANPGTTYAYDFTDSAGHVEKAEG